MRRGLRVLDQNDRLLSVLAELKEKAGGDGAGVGTSPNLSSGTKRARADSVARRLELPKIERIVARIVAFSECEGECEGEREGEGEGEDCQKCQGCAGCRESVAKLTLLLQKLTEKFDQLEIADYKELRLLAQKITSHLQKEHKLISETYHTGMFMILGLSIGFIFGLTIFNNPTTGVGTGMVLGVAIGAGLDADAKKKGRVI